MHIALQDLVNTEGIIGQLDCPGTATVSMPHHIVKSHFNNDYRDETST